MRTLILSVLSILALSMFSQPARAEGLSNSTLQKIMRPATPSWLQIGENGSDDVPPVLYQADGEFQVLKRTWDANTNEFKTSIVCYIKTKVDVYDATNNGNLGSMPTLSCATEIDGKTATAYFSVIAAEVRQKSLFMDGKLEYARLVIGGLYVWAQGTNTIQQYHYTVAATADLNSKNLVGFVSPMIHTLCVGDSEAGHTRPTCNPSTKEYFTLTYKVQN